jgi:lipid-binding SYLF domain-containing protein
MFMTQKLRGALNMSKALRYGVMVSVALLAIPLFASDREDDVSRIDASKQVFHEVMNTPDHGIPLDLLASAKCIAIIPGSVKFAFILGGNYGRGIASCRTENGWSAPMFVALDGGSVGYQAGGSATDIILLFMNDHALQHLLSDKFKLGADASVAAGPVGRTASADTDASMRAEVLSYSRAHGIFAGVSLDGAVVQTDHSGDVSMYGHEVSHDEILHGHVEVPAAARGLLDELNMYPRKPETSQVN